MKLLQWEFEFDKDDAKIVIPVLLLLLALTLTPLNKVVLWWGAVVYYALYFFLRPSLKALKEEVIAPVRNWFVFRCPHCKSRDIFQQGLSEYHGDVPYYWHLCNHCGETSIFINSPNEKFIKPGPGRGAKELAEKEVEPPF
jgi:hypothetical protein